MLQRQWIGKKVYTTISGKGDAGRPAPLAATACERLVYWTTMPWLAFTIILYALILVGGFVKSLGIDNTPTLQHYVTAFGIDWTEHGLLWSGRAWPSFFTTIELAAIAAPFTAAIGLLTAYLLNRQRFIGQSAFEFITMLSFAIPGTVIGVSYIIAFNVPPIELTGTGLILIICFVFRNMPVSIRAGLATMAQIDKSLDECSLLLRHGSFATIRRVDPAAAAARHRRLARLCVRARDHLGERRHLPGQRAIQSGHRLYRRARRGFGFRRRHRLQLGADRLHAAWRSA